MMRSLRLSFGSLLIHSRDSKTAKKDGMNVTLMLLLLCKLSFFFVCEKTDIYIFTLWQNYSTMICLRVKQEGLVC